MRFSLSRSPRTIQGILLRCGAVFCFALMSALMKWASENGAGLVELLFFRSVVGLPVTLAWLALGPGIGTIRTKNPRAHLLRSGIGLVSLALLYQALMLLPIADAVTLGFAAPAFATLLSALLLHEKVGGHRWAAVTIGFAGVVIVANPSGSSLPLAGVVYALLGAAANAAVTVTIREMGGRESHGAIVFWFFTSATLVSGAGMLFHAAPHPPVIWAVLIAGGIAGAGAQLLMTRSLQLAPVPVLAPFDYSQIVWAVLLGWLVWSALPGPGTFLGGAMIVASGLYTVWREHRRHRTRAAAADS